MGRGKWGTRPHQDQPEKDQRLVFRVRVHAVLQIRLPAGLVMACHVWVGAKTTIVSPKPNKHLGWLDILLIVNGRSAGTPSGVAGGRWGVAFGQETQLLSPSRAGGGGIGSVRILGDSRRWSLGIM